LGAGIVDQLLSNDTVEKILIYDDLSRNNYNTFSSKLFSKNSKLEFVKGNILDQKRMQDSLKGIDTVFHLAAKVNEPEGDIDSQFFEQTNNWGTAILANEIEKSDVDTVVYSSSVYVYGHTNEYVSPGYQSFPNSFYGISKKKGEDQLKAILSDERQLYIFRIGNIFGHNSSMRFDVLINKLVFDALFSKNLRIYGDGTQKRPFIQVDSCAKTMTKAVLDNQVPAGIYNLFDKHYSVLEIVKELSLLVENLEYTYVNRHMPMKDILVSKSDELSDVQSKATILGDELRKLVEKIY